MTTQSIMTEALRARFTAQQKEALATLHVYFTNPAGIGEHPQIIEEAAEQLKKLAEADDCLHTLDKHFMQNSQING